MKIVTSQEFEGKMMDRIINRGKEDLSSISLEVGSIIANVRKNGDEALLSYTEKFDNVRIPRSKLKITMEEIEKAYKKLERSHIDALKKAAINITLFHEKQLRAFWSFEIEKGVTIGQRTQSLSSAGIYVPGGKASYPSSLLMCAIPAKIAGIKKIVACSPPGKDGNINPALLVAADVAGVDAIYRVGGAQAIAAMAYGTETIPTVDKIVGPGNVFVTAAKLEVSKDVAIDIPAGPSEILIIADETAKASFVASDLLAQAEHDSKSWAILLTTSKDLALAVKEEIDKQVPLLSRMETIASSIQRGGLIVVVRNIEEAVYYANLIAPEHLHIQTKAPQKIFDKVQNAGSVFMGEYSLVAFGDYSSGLTHVLPTGGYAKLYSGLSTKDFMKTINFLQCNKQGFQELKKTTITLAKMEGFDGHARSVSIRSEVDES